MPHKHLLHGLTKPMPNCDPRQGPAGKTVSHFYGTYHRVYLLCSGRHASHPTSRAGTFTNGKPFKGLYQGPLGRLFLLQMDLLKVHFATTINPNGLDQGPFCRGPVSEFFWAPAEYHYLLQANQGPKTSTNHLNKGWTSADRITEGTLMLTVPRSTIVSSTQDLT